MRQQNWECKTQMLPCLSRRQRFYQWMFSHRDTKVGILKEICPCMPFTSIPLTCFIIITKKSDHVLKKWSHWMTHSVSVTLYDLKIKCYEFLLPGLVSLSMQSSAWTKTACNTIHGKQLYVWTAVLMIFLTGLTKDFNGPQKYSHQLIQVPSMAD